MGPRTEHSHTGRVEEDGEDGEVEDGLLKEHPDDLAAGVPEIGAYRKTERNRFTIGTHTHTHTHTHTCVRVLSMVCVDTWSACEECT